MDHKKRLLVLCRTRSSSPGVDTKKYPSYHGGINYREESSVLLVSDGHDYRHQSQSLSSFKK